MSAGVIKAKVNQFPSLTWNHLNINNTDFDCNIDSAASVFIEGQGDKVVLTQKLYDDFYGNEHITTGLGSDFDRQYDSIVKENNFAINEFSVSHGESISSPVKLTYSPDNDSSTSSDTVIIAGKGSESTFIFYYVNDKSYSGVFGNRIRIFAHDNSTVHIVVVNLLGQGFKVFNSIGAVAEDNARVDVTEVELGSSLCVTGTLAELKGYKSCFTGNASYTVIKDHYLDFNQVVNQYGRETKSIFSVDGVIMDNAKKTWRGTIDFKNGCIDAKGDEQENVLLLSPCVVNKSLPVILCDEEQVEGRHGCSIGKLDTDKLFYMQSRGVDEKTAQELMTKAKVTAVSRNISDKSIVDAIQEYVEGIFVR